MHIPLSSPDIREEDRAAVLKVLESGELSLGPRVAAFERAVTQLTGSHHAIAVNSGTSGLHLCVKAANIGEGDEVITTPFSFVASANCILFERAKPVFVDIDPVTLNIDPAKIEAAITPRTKAILPVHVFGRPCKLDEIVRVARKHGLAIIEDACEAIGAKYRGRPVGTFGQTGVFAFYPNKQMTTGEGGVIVTNDATIAARCRSWRNQGRSPVAGFLDHDSLGYNYRLSDINCALGLSQISRIYEILASRSRVAESYDKSLKGMAQIVRPQISEPNSTISWFVYVVRLNDDFSQSDRDRIIAELRNQGVECRNYFPPIHLQPLYRKLFGFGPGSFPITEHVSERTMAIPFFNRLSEKQISFVCKALEGATLSLRDKPVPAVQAPLSAEA